MEFDLNFCSLGWMNAQFQPELNEAIMDYKEALWWLFGRPTVGIIQIVTKEF